MSINHMGDITVKNVVHNSIVGQEQYEVGNQTTASIDTYTRVPVTNNHRTMIMIRYDSLSVGSETMTLLVDGHAMASTVIPSNQQEYLAIEVISVDHVDASNSLRCITNKADESLTIVKAGTGSYDISFLKTSGTGYISYAVTITDI